VRADGGAGRGRARGGAGVVRDRIRPKLGAVVVPRSRAAAAAAASRGMPGSSEPPAGAFELAARSAPVEARGDPGTVARPRKLVGTRRRRPWSAAAEQGAVAGGPAHEARGSLPL
jgi:hypothetical protein